MNNHALVVSFYSFLLILLAACSTGFSYKEEPGNYSSILSETSIPYIELVFPANKSRPLALQLALVKHKKQAAQYERWLLLHHISYQWLWVDWKGEQWQLLAVGPFKSEREMIAQRIKIKQGLASTRSIPAIALLIPKENKDLGLSTLAEIDAHNSSHAQPHSEIKETESPY